MKKLYSLLFISSLAIGSSLDTQARYRGDLNGDDRVDLADMVFLAKAIQAGSSDKALDINASGKVDDYDLHRLADIIISGALADDSGMNVGIGGWDDSGEDYGGIVKAPAVNSHSSEDTEFYIKDPRYESEDTYSIEFGIRYGDFNPCAMLISLLAPVDGLNGVVLDESVLNTHMIYGKPKMTTINDNEDYTPERIRFIIFSPDLKNIESSDGRLGRIYYSMQPSPYTYSAHFVNSQIIGSDGSDCVVLREHDSGFYGHFDPDGVDTVEDDAPCDIFTSDGRVLKKAVPPSEIQHLSRGLYIIHRKGHSSKLLK